MPGDGDDSGVDGALTDRIESILSELDAADLERVAPRAAVWEGIEQSIASGSPPPREPPSRVPATTMVVEYAIDADDILIEVGQSWADFAADNDAPEMAVPPSDRTLWTYFDSDEVRELWQLLVRRVRSLDQATQIPLRCDAPNARRWFEMTVTPEAEGSVHFHCVLVLEEARAPVSLLDPHSARNADLPPLLLCSWCGRGQHGARWVDVEELVRASRLLEELDSMPPLSHGICATCRDDMRADLLVVGEVGGSSA